MRLYSKHPAGESITIDVLIQFIIDNRFYRRKIIPDNMFYNQHVKDYFDTNKDGTFRECVELWWKKKNI